MQYTATDPNWLHYHLGMLPYREKSRLTKEGTTWTSGQIAQIGSKASQTGVGERTQTDGRLFGEIPCIKESWYLHENLILPPL